jgi:hypothetical protein
MPRFTRFITVVPGLILASALVLSAETQEFLHQAAEANVNRQYMIETVSFAGVEVGQNAPAKLPKSLRERLRNLVGQRIDITMLDELSADIRRQMHFRSVNQHLSRGSSPDMVRVNFEVVRRDLFFDISLPKFLYHSRQGFSGEVDASTHVKQNDLSFGVVSNGDDLTERFTGFTARYDSVPFADIAGAERMRFGVTFEDYHVQWNESTLAALAGSDLDLYHSRWNVAPEVVVRVAAPLTVSFGTSFTTLESEAGGLPGRSVNAGTFEVRYGRKIEGNGVQHEFEGRYSLRIATHALGSTYSYARHLIDARYQATMGRHTVSDELLAGSIAGKAPLFDRFVLGSSSTLQGWNRYEIDPLGGSRVVHNQVTYGYRIGRGTVQGFYDAGMLWQSDRAATLRHSLGCGYKQGVFVMAMAFPLREGRIEPVFMAGMNY